MSNMLQSLAARAGFGADQVQTIVDQVMAHVRRNEENTAAIGVRLAGIERAINSLLATLQAENDSLRARLRDAEHARPALIRAGVIVEGTYNGDAT